MVTGLSLWPLWIRDRPRIPRKEVTMCSPHLQEWELPFTSLRAGSLHTRPGTLLQGSCASSTPFSDRLRHFLNQYERTHMYFKL